MATIDDRVISMSFESAKFQSGVSMTMESLQKLNASLKDIGVNNGLDGLEKSANKVTFSGLQSALSKVKGMFGFREATDGFSNIEKSADGVTFHGLTSALDRVKSMFGFGLGRQANEAFAGIETSSGRVTFSGLGRALDGITSKFSVLTGAASVAFGNIAFQAIQSGERIVKSFTLDPVIAGFHNYETQINAIQVILANTGLKGKKGLDQVNQALNQLNTYANKTVYNFSEMAKNIGTFTAAGVDLKTATEAIKGIANLAALSGSSSQQASTAMYQLSQAIAAGQVHLQDWNSVVNAGMGGTVFQRALAQTAEAMGTLKDGAVKLVGPMKTVTINGESFRQAMQVGPGKKSWLTSGVLTTALKEFTGDMSKAQLAAVGFSDSQIKAIQAQGKVAVHAATNIKTITQLMEALKEEVATSWGAIFKTIFGDLGHATKLFSAVHIAVENAITGPIYAFNKVLQGWSKLGGRTDLFAGLRAGVKALGSVLEPIKNAFHDIFPPATAASLASMTKNFRDLMESLKIGPKTADELRGTFKGLFAILDIGKQVISGIFTALGKMFGQVGKSSGGILGLTSTIGGAIVAFDEWLKKGNRLHNFFAGLGSVLSVPIKLIGDLAGKLNGLLGGQTTGNLSNSLSGIGNALKPATKFADLARNAWQGFLNILDKVKGVFGPVLNTIIDAFRNISDAIAGALASNNWDAVFNVVQTALVGGLFLAIKKALGKGVNIDLGGGVLKKVSSSLDVLRGSLVQIQRNIQANTMLQIAIAVGALSAAVVALSLIDSKRLASSMTAIAVGLGQLMGSMALLNKIGARGSFLTMPLIAASLILLAGAMDTLSIAVLILSRLSWQQLAKGLAGVTGLLIGVSAASVLLSKAGPGMILAGIGLLGVATAIDILSVGVKIFSTMSWEGLGKGLASVAGLLTAIGLATQLMPLSLPITAAGLVLLGIALVEISGAMKIFGTMDMKTIGKGLLAIAGALVVIGLAMDLMPLTLPLTAAGLILVGIALNEIAASIALMGHMRLGTIVKGIAGLAGALVVLGIGMNAMMTSLPGAAGFLVIATALAIFVPALALLGHLSWGVIAKGLAAIAASLAIVAVAGSLAGPAFVALGVGLGLLGVGILAVGAGVNLLAKGLNTLGSDGAKGVAVVLAAITGFIALIPKVVVSFVKGIVEIVAQMAALAPQLAESFGKILTTLIAFIVKEAPNVATAFTAIIQAIITVIEQNAGPIIKAGFDLMVKFLGGLEKNIGRVTNSVANIVSKFLVALGNHANQLTTAGATFLVKFLGGISNNLGRVVDAAGNVVVKFVAALVSQVGKIATAGANAIIKFVAGITNNLGRIVTAGTTAVLKFISGVENNMERVINKGVELAGKFINAIVKASLKLVDIGAQAVIKFINGVADAIGKYSPQLTAAGVHLGEAIGKGVLQGLVSLPGALLSKVTSIASDAISSAEHFLGGGKNLKVQGKVIKPIGFRLVSGMADGIQEAAPLITGALTGVTTAGVQAFAARFVEHIPKVILDIGQYIGKSFGPHLLGSTQDINGAFNDLSNKLVDQYHTAGDKIKAAQERYDKLNGAKGKKRDESAIKKAKDDLDELRDIHSRTLAAHITLMSGLSRERSELLNLSRDFDKIAAKLDKAKQILSDAVRTRDDFKKSIVDSFSSASDIPQPTQGANSSTDPISEFLGLTDNSSSLATDAVQSFTDGLSARVTALKHFIDTLKQLRALGLDDKTYQKLLSDGLPDSDFADALLAAGPTAIAGITALDSQLTTAAEGLGQDASSNLYQAGVDAAQGIVNGLKADEGAIKDEMDKIAAIMINAIKRKLKIHSPSQAFREVGHFSMMGIAQGLTASSKVVIDASESVGDDALSAIRDKMAQISSVLADEIDPNPIITPILDLSKIKDGASQLAGMTNVVPITAAASYNQAADISATKIDVGSSDQSGASGSTVKFEQNNYSPQALSETEIYRQTRNQLSQLKSVLQ